ncbi:hypothetical protein Tco_0585512 [Tanacetum coccineum]
MALDSSSQPKQLTPASNVHFVVEDGIININNGIALLESKDTSYHPLLQFLKKICISVALTKQPSAYYLKYLREFWYTAEADTTTKTISFTLSNFDKPLSFDLDVFPLSSDAYKNDNLMSLKPHSITAISFKPTLENEVPLTTHMCKVPELSLEPIKYLISPCEEMNVDDSADKSSSRTSVQLTQPTEETVVTADITKSIDASKSAEEQENQPQTAEAKKVQEKLVEKEVQSSRLIFIGDATLEQLTDKYD